MEYGDIVWDNISDYIKQSLESLQLEADHIVTGATKLTSIQLLYDETGWVKATDSTYTKHTN